MRSITAALTVALWLGAGCWTRSDDGSNDRGVAVEVEGITTADLSDRRVLPGSIESPSRIRVTTQVSGRVASMPVDLDDTVERGQIVATLDREEYANEVQAAEANLRMARARHTEATVQAELAAVEAERAERLIAQDAVSISERDLAVAEQKRAEAGALVAEAQVSEARSVLQTARFRLSEASIVADWRGDGDDRVVAARHVDEGSVIAANTPLVDLVSLDPLRAVAYATDRDAHRIRPGQAVVVRSDAMPGERFEATVARVAPVLDEQTRQARVEIRVPNSDRKLRPGQFVQVEIVLDTRTDVTTVPARALVSRDGSHAVLRLGDDAQTVELIPVQIGLRDGDRVEVRDPPLTGRVVVLGQERLIDGARVRPVEPKDAP